MAVDRDGLHLLLWMRASPSRRTVKINQSELARELQTTRHTMSRVMSAMVDEERVVPIGKTYHNALYRIVDPAPWLGQDEGDAVQPPDDAHAVGS